MNARQIMRGSFFVALAMALVCCWSITRVVPRASACGGFFCQRVPINQAAEQIIFRQDGDEVRAVVLIQYVGEAEDFSWVLPVPANLRSEDLSTGSDAFFQSLERATRPQFTLEIEGEPCPQGGFGGGILDLLGPAPEEGGADDGVMVLEEATVGPFDVQVVSSDDPAAMINWLIENGYDLSDRGEQLITPYVEEGMNFVALKLRQDQGIGDIRPLVLKYRSDHPMIPIRLTAVAAEDDMGVLVWILGAGRAIPLNYLHVIPNYTLLNWYQGATAAYASYQGLITAAMNEAGGQGFATDYAAPLENLLEQLPSVETYDASLQRLESAETTSRFYEELIFGFVFPSDQQLEILRRQLPLTEGIDEFVYADPTLLTEAVGMEAADAARAGIISEITENIIEPLEKTLAVFEGDPYLTRLYTTLSPEEMTLDPTFSFNAGLEDQALERKATLFLHCNLLSGTGWRLQLGAGTGREGETVLEGTGDPPFFTPVIEQPNVFRAEFLREAAEADVQIDNSDDLEVVQIDGSGSGGLCGAGIGGCGGVSLWMMFTGLLALRGLRPRLRT